MIGSRDFGSPRDDGTQSTAPSRPAQLPCAIGGLAGGVGERRQRNNGGTPQLRRNSPDDPSDLHSSDGSDLVDDSSPASERLIVVSRRLSREMVRRTSFLLTNLSQKTCCGRGMYAKGVRKSTDMLRATRCQDHEGSVLGQGDFAVDRCQRASGDSDEGSRRREHGVCDRGDIGR